MPHARARAVRAWRGSVAGCCCACSRMAAVATEAAAHAVKRAHGGCVSCLSAGPAALPFVAASYRVPPTLLPPPCDPTKPPVERAWCGAWGPLARHGQLHSRFGGSPNDSAFVSNAGRCARAAIRPGAFGRVLQVVRAGCPCLSPLPSWRGTHSTGTAVATITSYYALYEWCHCHHLAWMNRFDAIAWRLGRMRLDVVSSAGSSCHRCGHHRAAHGRVCVQRVAAGLAMAPARGEMGVAMPCAYEPAVLCKLTIGEHSEGGSLPYKGP